MEYEMLQIEERIKIGIPWGESHFREFKSAFDRDGNGNISPRELKPVCIDIGEVLVSFANADGGELFIGVENDGTITGIPHKESLLQAMQNAYKTYVHEETPLSSPTIKLVSINEQSVLYFHISKSTTCVHLTCDGRCLKRFDKENRPISAERIQYERQEQRSREFDREFIDGATIKDLNVEMLDSISKQIALGHSPEKILQFFDLSEYGTGGMRLRRGALLLFAKDISRWHPRSEVRIMRVHGKEIGVGKNFNVEQPEPIRGNIIQISEDAWEGLRPHLARTSFQPNSVFKETILYPETACKEALVNAIAHRDYSSQGQPIEVFVFDDRLEIKSPGGLLSSIALESLKSLKRPHESRNVLISKVLRELGYMREIGEGITRIFLSMRIADLVDPEIRVEKDSFTIVLFHKSTYSQRDIEWLNGYKDFDLTRDEQRIILSGKDGHLLSTNEIIKTLNIIDTDDFRATYEKLRRKGLIFNTRNQTIRGGSRRRDIGRFSIRPSGEALQFMTELMSALVSLRATSILTPYVERSLKNRLSPNNPYAQKPLLSLQAIGFMNSQRQFLPKSRPFLSSATSTFIPSFPEALRQGVLKVKKEVEGYGFIQDDEGYEYFLHVSALLPPLRWIDIQIGAPLSFVVGERKIAGKSPSALRVRTNKSYPIREA